MLCSFYVKTLTCNRIFTKASVNRIFTLSHLMDCHEDKPVESSIRQKLQVALRPVHLEVRNESNMHNVPQGSETHFKVIIISDKFENVPLIARHRTVNGLLDAELKGGVHALSIVAKPPSQWKPSEVEQPSPKCLGGFGK